MEKFVHGPSEVISYFKLPLYALSIYFFPKIWNLSNDDERSIDLRLCDRNKNPSSKIHIFENFNTGKLGA